MIKATITCPRCNKPTHHTLKQLVEFGPEEIQDEDTTLKTTSVYEVTEKSNSSLSGAPGHPSNHPILDYLISAAAITICPECHLPSMISMRIPRKDYVAHQQDIRFGTRHVANYEIKDVFTEILPKPTEPVTDDDWPQSIRREFTDAQNMLMQGMSPSIIISTCRMVLDVGTKELGGSGTNIFSRVEDLKTKGIITAPIADWAHDIRKFGADATHDAEGTDEDAAAFVGFLKVFLNIAFTLPKKIENRRNQVAPEKVPAGRSTAGKVQQGG